MNKQKLELTWIGKENRPKLEPRILLEDPEKSYHAPQRMTENDIFDNRLIFGDNLLALKAVEHEFAGKIKCIFIDPPYNTGAAFAQYDDGLEHSIWLSLIRDRLDVLRRLLSEDGSIWITIDENEAHYLKVLCDEIFGRNNFLANVVWQKRTSPDNRLRLGDAHDSILVYCKDKLTGKTILNQLPVSEERNKDFRNLDNDPRGPWASTDFTGMTGHATPNQFYTIVSPTGRKFPPPPPPPPPGRCWYLQKRPLSSSWPIIGVVWKKWQFASSSKANFCARWRARMLGRGGLTMRSVITRKRRKRVLSFSEPTMLSIRQNLKGYSIEAFI